MVGSEVDVMSDEWTTSVNIRLDASSEEFNERILKRFVRGKYHHGHDISLLVVDSAPYHHDALLQCCVSWPSPAFLP